MTLLQAYLEMLVRAARIAASPAGVYVAWWALSESGVVAVGPDPLGCALIAVGIGAQAWTFWPRKKKE